jgi:hypothetical protein
LRGNAISWSQKSFNCLAAVREDARELHPIRKAADFGKLKMKIVHWRDGRVVEGARLESVFRGNSNVGSNPTLSAIPPLLHFTGNIMASRRG